MSVSTDSLIRSGAACFGVLLSMIHWLMSVYSRFKLVLDFFVISF